MDNLIRLTRKYWATGDTDILGSRNAIADDLSNQAFNSDHLWINFTDLVGAAVCFDKNITNDKIYQIFKVIGITVKTETAEVSA